MVALKGRRRATDRIRIVGHMAGREVDPERLATITQKAAEIAALVPEHLQEAAFNRAFDQLSGTGEGGASGSETRDRRGQRRQGRQAPSPTEDVGDPAAILISSLSRTDHPEVARAPRALDRALHVLRIAEARHQIDGMTASQIAKVLTDKFRLRVSRQAVGQALDVAGDYVDRTPTNKGAIYRLMQPGENYLDAGGATQEEDGDSPQPSRRRRRRASSKSFTQAKPKETSKAKSKTESSSSSARKRAKRGPKPLVEDLISEGFFDQPRTIGAIQDQLRHKKGMQFKATDLSPALVRLLRQDKLDRDRNESNHYEYRVPA